MRSKSSQSTEPLPPEAIQAIAEAAKSLDPTEPLPAATYTPAQGAKNAAAAGRPMPLVPMALGISQAGGISRGGQQSCEIAIGALGRAAKRDPMVWPILIDALKGCSSPKLAADQLAMIRPASPALASEGAQGQRPARARGRCAGTGTDGEASACGVVFAGPTLRYSGQAKPRRRAPRIWRLRYPDWPRRCKIRTQAYATRQPSRLP